MGRCKKICTSPKIDKIYTKKKFCITEYDDLKFIYLLEHNQKNLHFKFFYYTMPQSLLK